MKHHCRVSNKLQVTVESLWICTVAMVSIFRGLRSTTIKAKAIFCLMTSKHYLSALPVRSTAASGSQVYESERAVNEYLLAHYGDTADQMPYDFGPKDGANFSGYLAQLCIDKRKGMKNGRALDVGCAVGGLTFRLAPGFKEVVGIDYSQHFVDAANQMKSTGQMNFTILKQGNIFEPRQTSFPKDIDRSKASFYHGDACNLEKSLGKFDLIIGTNLMCRLPSPRKFLKTVTQFLNPGGMLILVSPYSWLEEYTPKEEWIGAQMVEGAKNTDSYEELTLFMEKASPLMKVIHRENVPFTIREHERKFQYGVSDCVVFLNTEVVPEL